MLSATHIPVMLRESVSHLITDRGGNYIDATFGRGGHLKEILASISGRGSVYAFDRDPASKDQFEKAFRQDGRLSLIKMIHGVEEVLILLFTAFGYEYLF